MKMRKISHLIFGLLLFCSCSKDLETALVFSPLQDDRYVIPIENALASLEDFLIDQGMSIAKGGVNDFVDNYFAVSMPATKSSDFTGDILYAVNFNDDSGYALLAADSRIQEDILAVTDQGSVSERDFVEISFEKVPTENDDLSLSQYDEMVASGVLATQTNVVNHEVLSYAIMQIGNYKDGDSSGGNGGTSSETYSWRTVSEKPMLLRTAWTQSTYDEDIFNKYCPMVGLVWEAKAPAGCVCIAVSQIMAFHEYPENLVYNDMPISYPDIKIIYSYDGASLDKKSGTDAGKEMLARYCIDVGSRCNTQYHAIFGNSFGFAWPWNAKKCLENFGYQNVSFSMGYDESKVLSALDNDCPVFMSAIAKLFAGHAWVIDGYMKREYVSSAGRVLNSQTLVHCNWGWAGDSNGYFTSGIFRTSEAQIYDTGLTQNEKYKFWYAFNIITYDNPQK